MGDGATGGFPGGRRAGGGRGKRTPPNKKAQEGAKSSGTLGGPTSGKTRKTREGKECKTEQQPHRMSKEWQGKCFEKEGSRGALVLGTPGQGIFRGFVKERLQKEKNQAIQAETTLILAVKQIWEDLERVNLNNGRNASKGFNDSSKLGGCSHGEVEEPLKL